MAIEQLTLADAKKRALKARGQTDGNRPVILNTKSNNLKDITKIGDGGKLVTWITGEPVESKLNDHLILVTLDEACEVIDRRNAEIMGTPWEEISEESFMTAFNEAILDKVEGDSFRAGERTLGIYVQHYLSAAGRFFTASREISQNFDRYFKEINEQFDMT